MKYIPRRRQTLSARSRAALALTVLSSGAVAALLPQAAHAQAANGITFTSLYSFGNYVGDGTNPYKALTVGPNGNFYGVDYNGGVSGDGSVFEITSAGTESTLYSFSGSTGENPRASLVLGSDGSLYGTTENGGVSGDGTIFKFDPTTNTVTTLHSFSGTDGIDPTSSIVFDNSGDLYGTCDFGGANGEGDVYELNSTFTVLHSFAGADGQHPISGVVLGSDGNLYGTALNGPQSSGEVYQVTPSGTLTVLYAFSGNDGSDPEATLTLASDGDFYGTTTAGGANGDGTVFKVSTTGTLNTLYSFSGTTDGANPYGPLLQMQNGGFYGTTRYGGPNNTGTIFQISTAGKLSTLYSFSADPNGITDDTTGNSDGAYPFCSLLMGTGGAVYGTTNGGGATNDGTVFKITGAVGSGVRFDFNGDGHADFPFYNNSTGQVSVWDMDDTTVLSYGGDAYASVDPSSGWIPVTAPSANGDGYPDLMWWNRMTGELSLWTLQNTTVKQFGDDFATVPNTNWQPVAVGDDVNPTYNLVFQNMNTGDISVWEMNNQSVVQFGGTLSSLGPNSPWQIVGAPDLDGDGKSDLLFYNTQTGEVSYWSCDLSNNTVLAYHGDIAQVPDLNQHLIGAEDLNGDGYADLIWRDQTTGVISRWLMQGTTVEQYSPAIAQVTNLSWRPDPIR